MTSATSAYPTLATLLPPPALRCIENYDQVEGPQEKKVFLV